MGYSLRLIPAEYLFWRPGTASRGTHSTCTVSAPSLRFPCRIYSLKDGVVHPQQDRTPPGPAPYTDSMPCTACQALLVGALLTTTASAAQPGVFDLPADFTAKATAKPVKGEQYVDIDAFGKAAAKVMPAAVTVTHAIVRELRWRLPDDHLYGPSDKTLALPNLPNDIHFLLIAGSRSLNYKLWVQPGQRGAHLAGATSHLTPPVMVSGKFFVPVSFLTFDLKCRVKAGIANCPSQTGRVNIPVTVRAF